MDLLPFEREKLAEKADRLLSDAILTPNEAREMLGMKPIEDESYVKRLSDSPPKIRHCPDCGANVSGGRCEYCGGIFT